MKAPEIVALFQAKQTVADIVRAMGVERGSVYRALEAGGSTKGKGPLWLEARERPKAWEVRHLTDKPRLGTILYLGVVNSGLFHNQLLVHPTAIVGSARYGNVEVETLARPARLLAAAVKWRTPGKKRGLFSQTAGRSRSS